MKKLFLVVFIVFMIMTGVSCKNINTNNIKELSKNESVSKYGNYKLYKWNEEISLPFPAPIAESYSLPDYGGIKCNMRSITDFSDYLKLLKKDGWELLGDSEEGRKANTIYYYFIKDNMSLSLTDQVPWGYLNIDFEKGYIDLGKKRDIDKETAKKLIQEYIDGITDKKAFGFGEKVYRLTEADTGEAYDRIGIQAFNAYSEAGGINTYLICKGTISEEPFLDQITVVDIDKDGELEIINVDSWGSGIFRVDLVIHKYGVPMGSSSKDKRLFVPCCTTYVPNKGAAKLMLVKVSDTKVKLYGAEKVKGELVPKTDYGVLKYDGKHLYTDAKNFPFKEWGDYFNKKD